MRKVVRAPSEVRSAVAVSATFPSALPPRKSSSSSGGSAAAAPKYAGCCAASHARWKTYPPNAYSAARLFKIQESLVELRWSRFHSLRFGRSRVPTHSRATGSQVAFQNTLDHTLKSSHETCLERTFLKSQIEKPTSRTPCGWTLWKTSRRSNAPRDAPKRKAAPPKEPDRRRYKLFQTTGCRHCSPSSSSSSSSSLCPDDAGGQLAADGSAAPFRRELGCVGVPAPRVRVVAIVRGEVERDDVQREHEWLLSEEGALRAGQALDTLPRARTLGVRKVFAEASRELRAPRGRQLVVEDHRRVAPALLEQPVSVAVRELVVETLCRDAEPKSDLSARERVTPRLCAHSERGQRRAQLGRARQLARDGSSGRLW